MKKLSELIEECKEKGISLPDTGKVSKNDLIRRLAEHHLQSNSGEYAPLEQITPQLAKDIRDLPESERKEVLKNDKYVCGEKINGVRGILHVRPEGIRITSRNRYTGTHLMNELSDNLPHLRTLDLGSWEGSVFDGELYLKKDFVTLDARATVLEATTALLHCDPTKARGFQGRNGTICYHIFDVLRSKNDDLTSLPLRERIQYLNEFKQLVPSRGYGETIDFETLVLTDKEEYLTTVLEAGGEGVVFKDLDAPYSPGSRPRSWLKVKRNSIVDAVIIGFDRGKEWDRKGLIGSVELGVFDEEGRLRSIGRVCSFPLQKRLEMTEIVEGSPALKREFLGTIVECCFQDLNKNLKGRHLQIMGFRTGVNAKSIEECFLDLSKEKEKLRRAGMTIPDSLPTPNFLTAYLLNP